MSNEKVQDKTKRIGLRFWSPVTGVLTALGRMQLALTKPRWIEPWAGFFYIFWFTFLVAVPQVAGFSGPWQASWACAVHLLALSLAFVYFRHDGEKEAARRGLLEGRGEFVTAADTGNESEPLLDLRSNYQRRLGMITLISCGLGMTAAFALLCQGLYRTGYRDWYYVSNREHQHADVTQAGHDRYGYWALYSGLSVFRALDLVDTFQTYGLEFSPIRHQGTPASTLTFLFKIVIDILLIAKLRRLLGNWSLYRQVAASTKIQPTNRAIALRRLGGSLLATGDLFTRWYALRYVCNSRKKLEERVFAGQILAATGSNGRKHAGKIMALLLEADGDKQVDAVRNLMEALGRLELRPEHLLDLVPPPEKSAAALPENKPKTVWKSGFEMEFIAIQQGTFMMGSPVGEPGRGEGRETLHQVKLTKDYWLGKYPVTQEQYRLVTGLSPSFFTPELIQAHMKRAGQWLSSSPHNCHPVENVNWYEAQLFCVWMTLQEWAAGTLPKGWAYRLPSEAEWEYAARAGTSTGLYTGEELNHAGMGLNLDKIAWYDRNSGFRTHAVGELAPNRWNLHDMLGNVWEWCSDWNVDELGPTSAEDPVGPSTGTHRIIRGGCFSGNAANCRSGVRLSCQPEDRGDNFGFRVALSRIYE